MKLPANSWGCLEITDLFLVCEECGKRFRFNPKTMSHGRRFCDRTCYDQARSQGKLKRGKTVDLTCETCGKTFKRYKSAIQVHNFCCRACFDSWFKENPPAPTVRTRLQTSKTMRAIRPGKKKRRPKLLGKDMHRTIMEQYLGRKLRQSEVVHHINEDPFDNRLDNLQLMRRGEHVALHNRLRKARRVAEGVVSK